MKTLRLPLVAAGAALALAPSAPAQAPAGAPARTLLRDRHRHFSAPAFVLLGDLPGGAVSSYPRAISPDGWCVVGSSVSAEGQEAFVWTPETGMVGIGDLAGGPFESEAKGVSTGGTVVVGYGRTDAGYEAFRWTPATGMVRLGDLPGGATHAVGLDVDARGEVLIGYGTSEQGTEGFRWTAAEGMVGLGDLSGGVFASRALRISADGRVIVGDSSGVQGATGVRWVDGGPVQDVWPNGDEVLPVMASAVSLDGTWIGGLAVIGALPVAFRWRANVITSFGTDPYQTLGVLGISHDGRRFVGPGQIGGGQTRAWIWEEKLGLRDLKAAMEQEYGLDLAGWTITNATDLSGDGQRVVGVAEDAQHRRHAFLAWLPIRCRADLNGDDVVDLADAALFAAAYANGTALADFDGDGFVTEVDQEVFTWAFQLGCD